MSNSSAPAGYCGCGKKLQKTNVGGLCGACKRAARNSGPEYAVLDGEEIARIPLTQGRVAIVNAEDGEWISQWTWYFSRGDGYARRNSKPELHADGKVRRRSILMHNALMHASGGFELDHRNRNRLDNRRSNLRIVTRKQNMYNKRAYSSARGRAPSSRYKGVYWSEMWGCWRAAITADAKRRMLGHFDCEEEAAIAYDVAAQSLHGEYAHLNFAPTSRPVISKPTTRPRPRIPECKKAALVRAREECEFSYAHLARVFSVDRNSAMRICRQRGAA